VFKNKNTNWRFVMATNSRTFIPHVVKIFSLVQKLKVGRGRGREVSKFAHVLIFKSTIFLQM
jgi:hypothetical protein